MAQSQSMPDLSLSNSTAAAEPVAVPTSSAATTGSSSSSSSSATKKLTSSMRYVDVEFIGRVTKYSSLSLSLSLSIGSIRLSSLFATPPATLSSFVQ